MVMIAITCRDKATRTIQEENQNEEESEKIESLNLNDLNKGKCFLKLKCSEMDSLESQVKELYEKIKLNSKVPTGEEDDE